MNTAELRRLLFVVVPASFALAVVAVLVAIARDSDVADAPPLIDADHWHARYAYIVCDELQPFAPAWEGGVHTHADGIIHIHPVDEDEEGRGARLVKWFEYGGGVLAEDEVRLPGEETTHHNGDECEDGSAGIVQVYVTPVATGVEERVADFGEYIPQDGDLVVIYFGPELDEGE